MSEINNDAINIIQRIIQVPVSEGSYEQFHGALIAGTKQMIPRQVLVDGYLELAAFHASRGDVRNNINVLEEARELSKTDYPVIFQLAKSLGTYWTKYSEELCELDLIWLSQYLQRVDDDLSESKIYFTLRAKLNRLYSLTNKVQKAATCVEQVAETKHTLFLSQLTTKQYEGLTPDERKQRVAEILGKKLRELYNKSIKHPETDAEDKSDAS